MGRTGNRLGVNAAAPFAVIGSLAQNQFVGSESVRWLRIPASLFNVQSFLHLGAPISFLASTRLREGSEKVRSDLGE